MPRVLSARQQVQHVLRTLCRSTGAPARAGDVFEAAQASTQLERRAVVGALLSLAQTGEVLVVGHAHGLRSGGRRLYWPRGWPPPHVVPPPRTPLDQVFALLRTHESSASGQWFTSADLVAEASVVDPRTTWGVVFRCLRNLERRVDPLVQRRTMPNGHVEWRLLLPLGSNASNECPRQPPGERCNSRHDESITLRHLGNALAACGVRGWPLLSERALLQLAPVSARDEWAAQLRLEVDRAQRSARMQQHGQRPNRASDRSVDVALATQLPSLVGWFAGARYFSTQRHREWAANALESMRATEQWELLQRRIRRTPRFVIGEALAPVSQHPSAAEVAAHAEARTLSRRADGAAAALVTTILTSRSFARDAADTARTGEALIRSGLDWPKRVARSLRQAQASQTGSTLRTSIELIPECTCTPIAPLHHALSRLLGVKCLTSTLMRRRLRASDVWRTWRPELASSPSIDQTERELVLWELAEALWWWGTQRGGPHTRRVLRATQRYIGWAQLTPAEIDVLLRSPIPAIRLASLAYLSCGAQLRDPSNATEFEERLRMAVDATSASSRVRRTFSRALWTDLPSWFREWLSETHGVLRAVSAPLFTGGPMVPGAMQENVPKAQVSPAPLRRFDPAPGPSVSAFVWQR